MWSGSILVFLHAKIASNIGGSCYRSPDLGCSENTTRTTRPVKGLGMEERNVPHKKICMTCWILEAKQTTQGKRSGCPNEPPLPGTDKGGKPTAPASRAEVLGGGGMATPSRRGQSQQQMEMLAVLQNKPGRAIVHRTDTLYLWVSHYYYTARSGSLMLVPKYPQKNVVDARLKSATV